MSKKALLIHGISFFDERRAVRPARLMLASCGYPTGDVNAFNWDLTVGHPLISLNNEPFNLRFLVEVGAGLLESSHLGFFRTNYLGQSAHKLFLQNTIAFLFQITVLLFPFWLLAVSAVQQPLYLLLDFAILMILLLAFALIAGSGSFVCATIRRVILICVWPLTYVITVPIFVPGSLMLILLGVAFFSPLGALHSGVDPKNALAFLQNTADYVVTTGVPLLVLFFISSFLPVLPIGALAKLLADVVRYIGLPGYRSKILDNLSSTIKTLHLDADSDLLLLTHSLGSVIAVDYLLKHTEDVATVRSVTLVTMGSPLRRYFARFFSGFYPSPDTFFDDLNCRIKNFKWINIYRENDPIGSCLSDSNEKIYNKRTPEYLSPFKAHCSYFSSRSVYRCLEESLSICKDSLSAPPPEDRLEFPESYSKQFGWSSNSVLGSLWSGAKSAIDSLSNIIPPMGVRHFALFLLPLFALVACVFYTESQWEKTQLRYYLTHNGAKVVHPDMHWAYSWAEFVLLLFLAPIVWSVVGLPFLRMALVSVDSFPETAPHNPVEEMQLRKQIAKNTRSRLLSLTKPLVVIGLLIIFLLVTGYWAVRK